MLRIVNELGDRMLALFVPRVTASAADCGSVVLRTVCRNGFYQVCRCFSNSNCACLSCEPTTTRC
ncbi:hypothetical protein E0H26_22930 [Micromonospora zingiberis]|uniref:Uncharacterized protein n=1 Tax=Micromonospora zingiberis TaxID=2053011 RepID=A0A4R0GDG6_9ACTN|nr:hypothetical protein [Micromonospora zingiberis]TCB93398.1 hypothetical protein E0H26_22930 [Micromonospora zingiberis]